jgi:broad specificity phosphatase PhoE
VIELWYETHSISIDNERGIATGWLPGELSEHGRELAAERGPSWRDRCIQAVFSSDLSRALQTAEIARVIYPFPLLVEPDLRECNYGDLNGRPVREIDVLRLASIDRPFPNGESYGDVVERTRRFLLGLGPEWDGTTVAVVAHSANRWALDLLLRGRPLAESIASPFNWQPGWRYELAGDWRAQLRAFDRG